MKSILTEQEIEEISERCSRATKGPWISYVEGRDHISGSNFIMTGLDDNRGNDIELIGATINDQDFIAHAREDIPKLLAELASLKKQLKIIS